MGAKTSEHWSSAKEFSERGLPNQAIGGGVFTAKACMPLLDYMTSGYIIRSFADVAISAKTENGINSFVYVTGDSSQFGSHPNIQLPSIGDGVHRDYIKFNSPWSIETPPGYSCLFFQPEYFFEKRFKLLPAIVDTDKYTNPVNFPGLMTQDGDFTIKAGTPLMCVFPFKREEFSSSVSLGRLPIPITRGFFKQAYKIFCRAKKVYE